MNFKRLFLSFFFAFGALSCSLGFSGGSQGVPSLSEFEEKGSKAIDIGDYDLAIELARPLADSGDPEAIFTIGYLMLEWLQDPSPKTKPMHSAEDAVCWIRRAAKLGVSQAASTLRVGYEWGRYSLPKNEALSLCWKAVELGEKESVECFSLETNL